MANQQNLSRRAALRQQQEMEASAKRRNRIIGIGAGIVVLAIVAIIAFVTLPTLLKGNDPEPPAASGEQLTPPNATEGFGIATQGKQPTEDIPNMVVYSDFRCPHCGTQEQLFGPVYAQLVREGKITVEHRATFFLDGGNPDNSFRAAIAAASADGVGKYDEYVKVLFENQAQTYSDEDFTGELAVQAGMTGEELKKFEELYTNRSYEEFVKQADEAFQTSGATGTPTYAVGDRRLNFFDQETQEPVIQPTPESLLAAITKAHNGEDDPSNEVMGS